MRQTPTFVRKFSADIVLPLATKSLMLEFCFTHSDSIRILFPGDNDITIQSISGSQERRNEREEKGTVAKEEGKEK